MALQFNPFTGTFDVTTKGDTGAVAAAGDGTAAAPGITFASDTNTGIYRPGEDQLALSTGGTGRLFISSTGQIGIGGTPSGSNLNIIDPVPIIRLTDSDTNGYSQILGSDTSLYIDADRGAAGTGALIFRTSGTNERLRITSTGQLSHIGAGSSGSPAVSFSGSAPSNSLVIDASGRAGLGTSTPTGGGLNVSSNTANAIILQRTNNTTGIDQTVQTLRFLNGLAANNYSADISCYQTTAFPDSVGLQFKTKSGGTADPVTRMTINGLGNVGIGTASPGALFHSSASNNGPTTVGLFENTSTGAAAYTNIQLKAGTNTALIGLGSSGTATGNLYIGNDQNKDLDLYTGSANIKFLIASTERARIDSSGRLLVGTFTSTNNITFQRNLALVTTGTDNLGGADFTSYPGINAERSSGLNFQRSRGTTDGSMTAVTSGDRLGNINFSGSDGTSFQIAALIAGYVDGAVSDPNNSVPGRLVFSTTADGAASPTERMRIRNTGVVATSRGLVIGNLTGGTSDDALIIAGGVIASGAGTNALKWNSSTGVVTYDTSSRLLKENITDCPYGIETVKALQPRKYFRVDDESFEIGFIADEVADLMPEFVPVGPKSVITRNDEDTEEIPLGVNYDKLTAVLTKALQEAIGEIESLKARVAALEAS